KYREQGKRGIKHMIDLALGILVASAVAAVVIKKVKDRKAGKTGCGCSGSCGGCNGCAPKEEE
ncbi:MAG: hypothetical protein RR685_10490, partial [Hungatella sp.]